MRYLLLLLSFAEVLLFTYKINIAGPLWSPVLLIAVSFAIALIYLKIAKEEGIFNNKGPTLARKWLTGLQVLVFCILSAAMFYKVYLVNASNPISRNDPSHSDVIPSIMHLASRFTEGKYPYTDITFPGYPPGYVISPTYLPFTWLPYVPAELFHFDYRWIPVIALWLVAAYVFCRSVKRQSTFNTYGEALLVPVWSLVIWCMMAFAPEPPIAYTVESMIAAYYLLLAISINRKNQVLGGIALGLCLLSRYSILFWVPLYFLIIFFKRSKSSAIINALIVLAFFVFLYWLPFLRINPSLLVNGYKYYTISARWEWGTAQAGGFWHLGNGLGMTKWMFKLFPGMDVDEKLAIYQKLHLIMITATIIVLLLFYFFRRKRLPPRAYLLFSLKIYLAVFYSFIQVPYRYLYLVPIMVTSALLYEAAARPLPAKELHKQE